MEQLDKKYEPLIDLWSLKYGRRPPPSHGVLLPGNPDFDFSKDVTTEEVMEVMYAQMHEAGLSAAQVHVIKAIGMVVEDGEYVDRETEVLALMAADEAAALHEHDLVCNCPVFPKTPPSMPVSEFAETAAWIWPEGTEVGESIVYLNALFAKKAHGEKDPKWVFRFLLASERYCLEKHCGGDQAEYTRRVNHGCPEVSCIAVRKLCDSIPEELSFGETAKVESAVVSKTSGRKLSKAETAKRKRKAQKAARRKNR